jgi:hypothetical protein
VIAHKCLNEAVFFSGDSCANRDHVNVAPVANLRGMGEGFVECGIT